MLPQLIANIILEFVNASTWSERKQIVEQHRNLLLTQEADIILQKGIAHNRRNPGIRQRFEECRAVLTDCQTIGIDAAFVFLIGLPPGLSDALNALTDAESFSQRYRLVVEHASLLLTNETDWSLVALASQNFEDALLVEEITQVRDLLARCRREGIDVAFADMLRAERSVEAIGGALALAENSPEEMEQILEKYRDVLLADKAEQNILDLLAEPDIPIHVHQISWLHTLLDIARKDGIPTAVLVYYLPPFKRFLGRTFMALAKRTSEPEDIAPNIHTLLEAHLDLLDEAFPAKLHDWAAEQLRDEQMHEDFSTLVQGLGNLASEIWTFPLGRRTDNQEATITCYEVADEFCQLLVDNSLHVAVLNNLGLVYMERVSESRDENIKRAISYYEKALALVDRAADPNLWAGIADNLGSAYVDLADGRRSENIEMAITLYSDAIDAISTVQHPNHPVNTSTPFSKKIPIKPIARDQRPNLWSSLHNDLGLAYFHRVRFEQAENIEQAISHCEQALTAPQRDLDAQQWAAIHSNLGLFYVGRKRGDPAQNVECAIFHCYEALEMTKRETAKEGWARKQVNLGRAYGRRVGGDPAENIERAIFHYEQALEVFKRDAFPMEWALIHNNLGNNFLRYKHGEAKENKQHAIQHIELALKVYTRKSYPEDWARATSDLAAAHAYVPFAIYTDFEEGCDAMRKIHDHFDLAIKLYDQALEIQKPELLPRESVETAYQLGQALAMHGRYKDARFAFETAHRALTTMREDASRASAKRSIAALGKGIYQALVRSCLHLGDVEAAFAYAAVGKGRAFADLLASARFDLSTASATYPDLVADLQRTRTLRQEIDGLLAYLSGETDMLPTTLNMPPTDLNKTRKAVRIRLHKAQAQEQTLWEDMAYAYPALTATQQSPLLTPDDARSLAAQLNATLVEFFAHEDGWSAFVVTAEAIVHVPLSLLTEGFIERIVGMVQRIGSRVERCPLSYRLLEGLHRAVMTPLKGALPRERPLILAPYGVLHRLPLMAALDPDTGEYAVDQYRLAFAPSLTALWVSWQQTQRAGAARTHLNQVLSVAYPGVAESRSYLPNVVLEAESVVGHFGMITRLHGTDATPDALVAHCAGHDIVHLGCHGAFNVDQPEQSGLMLSGGWLTVQRILTEVKLEHTRICTLGACMSGLAHVAEGDEPVGLAHAILVAGAEVVVASLWNVDDAATRTLFEAFYTGVAAGHSAADALYLATQSIRKVQHWQHPYYWAAFQVTGLAHIPTPGSKSQSALSTPSIPPVSNSQRDASMTGKNAETMVEDAHSLLNQLWRCNDLTEAALQELGADRQRILSVLKALPSQLADADDRRKLLELSHHILTLVEATPSLRQRFMLEDTVETITHESQQRELLLRQERTEEPMREEIAHLRDQMLTIAGAIASAYTMP